MSSAITRTAAPSDLPARRRRLGNLLAEAAEFEHSILCQYLFTAFSLKSRVEEGGVTWVQLEQMRHMMGAIRPALNGHVYQNYPVRNFPDFRWAYWGDAFPSLLFVKKKYDPENVFHFEQSISDYPNDPGITRSEAPSRFDDPRIHSERFSSPD